MKDIPRGDYQEYLELTKLILGGSIDRKNGYDYQIQRPGADHHARWMSKAIYILKMPLLIHQLDLHWRTKKKIQQMTLFAVFVYLESTLIFSLLELPHSFLNDPEWTERQEYREARSSLQKLTPLNDSSERALALATRLNSNITRNEESYQELVHVVEEHRKKYGLKTKEDLRKFN